MQLQKYLAKNPKKYIIFDLDGTLANLLIDWKGFRKNLRKIVATVDRKVAREIPDRSGVSNLLYNHAIMKRGEKARKLVLKYCESWERNHFKGIKLNKELVNFIKKNKRKYKFFIWSANNRKTVIKVLKQLNILSCVKKIITKEEVVLLKPWPDGFYLIADLKKQEHKDFLMVGDSDNDRLAAKAVGIDFFEVKM